MAKRYYQACWLADSEMNCYYFECEKRGNCEAFKQRQKELQKEFEEKEKMKGLKIK